jgi:SAM-dependent methyltransferase
MSDEYELIADLYDYVHPYQSREDIAFFVGAAKDCGGPVLELGCGTGRVLIPTARAGVQITGLDLSPGMLAVCRQRLDQESAAVRSKADLIRGDMREFNLGRTFSLITVPFRPFQHLITVEEQRSCLESSRKHLAVNGLLILDLFNPSLDALATQRLGAEFGEEPPFVMPDGRRVVRRHKIVSHDRFNQFMQIELLYYVTHPDGREERLVHAFEMRYLFRFEVEHLLARCGFETEAIYSGFDKSPYGSRYPGDLIVLARKSGD